MTVQQLYARKHTILGLLAIAIWSFGALLAVKLTKIPIFELLAFEFAIAFLVVALRYFFSSEKEIFFNFGKIDFLIAGIALVVNQVCYFVAFRFSPAVQVDLINYIWPTLVVLLSSFLPQERFSFSSLLACLICLFGLYYLLFSDGAEGFSYEYISGYFLAIGAALSWTFYTLYARYKKTSSANCISWACGLAAPSCFFIHLEFEEFIMPNLFEFALIAFLGVFQVGLAYYFWEKAIKRGCIRFIGLACYCIPVFSVMILVIFGKAVFEPKMLTATIMITFAPCIPIIKNKILPSRKANRKIQLEEFNHSFDEHEEISKCASSA